MIARGQSRAGALTSCLSNTCLQGLPLEFLPVTLDRLSTTPIWIHWGPTDDRQVKNYWWELHLALKLVSRYVCPRVDHMRYLHKQMSWEKAERGRGNMIAQYFFFNRTFSSFCREDVISFSRTAAARFNMILLTHHQSPIISFCMHDDCSIPICSSKSMQPERR